MTYEEFKQLAEHPQHRDIPAIFKLEVIEVEELPEKKCSHYPKYQVNTHASALAPTLEEAEKKQKEQEEKDRIYKQAHDCSIRNKEQLEKSESAAASIVAKSSRHPKSPTMFRMMSQPPFALIATSTP